MPITVYQTYLNKSGCNFIKEVGQAIVICLVTSSSKRLESWLDGCSSMYQNRLYRLKYFKYLVEFLKIFPRIQFP